MRILEVDGCEPRPCEDNTFLSNEVASTHIPAGLPVALSCRTYTCWTAVKSQYVMVVFSHCTYNNTRESHQNVLGGNMEIHLCNPI